MASGHEGWYRWVAANPNLHDRKVLDFGCGTGYGVATIAKIAAAVVGVDISPTAVEWATDRYGAHANVKFMSTDLCGSLPAELSQQKFDAVVTSEVLAPVLGPGAFLTKPTTLFFVEGIAVGGTP